MPHSPKMVAWEPGITFSQTSHKAVPNIRQVKKIPTTGGDEEESLCGRADYEKGLLMSTS